MKRDLTLTVTSLLSIILFAAHFADDIARGFEKGDAGDYVGILLVAAWLYATLALIERRAGLVMILLFSIGAAGVPLIHMTGAGLTGGRIANTTGVFFWVWTLVALGATGIVSAFLAARALWLSVKHRAR